jgi:leader peptidase (prepilin peptidase)/N-methyltransferase
LDPGALDAVWGDSVLASIAAAFGLVIGSFANVVIHRLPDRGEAPGSGDGPSAARPLREFFADLALDFRPDWRSIAGCWSRVANPRRSACPRCGAAIRAADNLPVLSFLLLGGRCRNCRAPIAWRYPAVEAANALLWGGLVLCHGATPRALVLLPLATALLVLALIDSELQQLPDAITIPGVLAGLAASLLAGGWPPDGTAFWPSLASALGGYLILASIALAWQVLRGIEALGQGDWKMAAMLGAFLGWRALLLTLFLAAALGALSGLALIASGRGDMQSKLPLGTFMALAGIAVLFFGDPWIAWYRGLLDA